jgi:hypothetical protein
VLARILIGVLLLLLATGLSACDGGSSSRVASPGSTFAATTTTATFACAPTRSNCTPEQVLATVRQIYETAGATASESACLAPISATGKHSLLQAFNAFSDAQTREATRCVGSDARLQVIAAGLISHFKGRLPGATSSQSCSTDGRLIVPISGSPPPPKNWETMSAQALRAAGWRIVHERLKPVCSTP